MNLLFRCFLCFRKGGTGSSAHVANLIMIIAFVGIALLIGLMVGATLYADGVTFTQAAKNMFGGTSGN